MQKEAKIPGGCAVAVKERRAVRQSILHDYWKHRYLVLLFLPALFYYLIFCYGPLYGIQIAFKDFSLVDGITAGKWVGLRYFRQLFALSEFWTVFKNTIIISGLKLIFGFPAPIIFAILLNELTAIRFKKAVQTISYLPHFLSWVILSSLFIQLLAPTTGPVNQLLSAIGLKQIYFMGDVNWFRPMVVLTSMWKEIGWGSIIFLAALTGINPEMYEAARIDGAGRWQRIFYITLPELTPVITIMFIFSVGNIVNDDFDQMYNMQNSAVMKIGDVLSTYVYRMGLVNMQYSFSTAIGLFKNLIAFALVMLANWFSKKISDYGIW